ncbi:MAG TPA: type II secretion system F family protein [Clostridium sp.]
MKAHFDNLCIIAENLGALYEDGITIGNAFELMEELPLRKDYRRSIKEINNKVLKGNSLGKSFNEHSVLYPSFFVGIISVGENSGELTKTLNSLSKYYGQSNKVKKELKAALIYPAFIAVSLILLMVLLFFILIPNMYDTFKGLNISMPSIIETIYYGSKWMGENILLCLTGLICYPIVIFILIKLFNIGNRHIGYKILLKFKIIREYYEYIFILLISVVLSSGISLVKGIEMCIGSTGKQVIEDRLIYINTEILKGVELSKSLNNGFLSKYSLSMITLGENSGSLEAVVKKLETRLERSMEEKLKKIITMITPIFIGGMAVVVFIFIYILVIPIMDVMYSGYK